MQPIGKLVPVYMETGRKRTFAGAVDWPGWCRAGADENSALDALLAAGPRYAAAMRAAKIEFHPPADAAAFQVLERLAGNVTTDFGAPDIPPSADQQPLGVQELQRLQNILRGCWKALDAAASSASGHELRLGPRGGGRSLGGILAHVMGAEAGYLSRLAWKFKAQDPQDPMGDLERAHQACLEALERAVTDGLPKRGPRGGRYWTPRYFVRRLAWHCLDHAWEIEDRII